MSDPQPRPIAADASYGLPEQPANRPPWPEIEQRLATARNYWLSTTRPDGRAHAAPVWGVWHEGGLYFGTSRSSVKGRNLIARETAVIHLESGDEVLILDGVCTEADAAAMAPIVPAYFEKYEIEIDLADDDGWYLCFRPLTALSWTESDFAETASGWDFPATT